MDVKIYPFFFCVLLLAFPILALEPPPTADGYITDHANLLSSDTKAKLEQALYNYEAKTSHQVVVALFPSLEGDSLEDFSIRLAEAWKIGQKGKDNGVILLIFPKDRKMRIEVGYGLEGLLTDSQAGQIIQNEITPFFQKGQFDEGVLAGVSAILGILGGSFETGLKQREAPPDLQPLFRLIGFVVGILFLADLVRYLRFRTGHRVNTSRYNFWEWWFRFAILFFLIQIIFKILFYALLSSRGGYSGGGSHGSGGGFSGGGGGSFGGGGASGSW